jgi:Glutathione S-transferase
MSLILFIEYFSQPSRAVLAFCSQAQIPYQVEEIRLKKGLNKTNEYKKVSPLGKVPAIKHEDFTLFESHAIMTYLASVFPVEDHWYPKDPIQRAKIDLYLH